MLHPNFDSFPMPLEFPFGIFRLEEHQVKCIAKMRFQLLCRIYYSKIKNLFISFIHFLFVFKLLHSSFKNLTSLRNCIIHYFDKTQFSNFIIREISILRLLLSRKIFREISILKIFFSRIQFLDIYFFHLRRGLLFSKLTAVIILI